MPRTRRIAAIALILFLIAELPDAARAGVTIGGSPVTPLVPRVVLQVLFIALLWWSGVRAGRAPGDEAGAE